MIETVDNFDKTVMRVRTVSNLSALQGKAPYMVNRETRISIVEIRTQTNPCLCSIPIQNIYTMSSSVPLQYLRYSNVQ